MPLEYVDDLPGCGCLSCSTDEEVVQIIERMREGIELDTVNIRGWCER